MNREQKTEADAALEAMRLRFHPLNQDIRVPDSLMERLTPDHLDDELESTRGVVLSFPWKRMAALAACCVVGFIGYYGLAGSRTSSDMTRDAASSMAAAPEPYSGEAAPDGQAGAANELAAKRSVQPSGAMLEAPEAAMLESGAEISADIAAAPNTGGNGGFYYSAAADESEASSSTVMNSGIELTSEQDALESSPWGAYLPSEKPEGLGFTAATLKQSELQISYQDRSGDAIRELFVSVREFDSAGDEAQLADAANPQMYDVGLYDMKAGQKPPEQYSAVFSRPLFEARDVTEQIVAARVKAPEGQGVYTLGSMGVRYGDMVVWYDVCNITPGELYAVILQTRDALQ